MSEGYHVSVGAHVRASKQAGEFSLLAVRVHASVAFAESPHGGKVEGLTLAVAGTCLPCGLAGRVYVRCVRLCLWGHGGVRASVVGAGLAVCNPFAWGCLAHLGCALALGLALGLGRLRLRRGGEQEVNQLSLGESHEAGLRGRGRLRRLARLLALGCARLEFRLELRFVGGLALSTGELAPCVWAVCGGVVGSCHG